MQTKGHSIQDYKQYKNKQFKNPRKRSYSINNDNVQSGISDITMQKKQRQFSLNSAFSRNSQQIADNLIISFVMETMFPMDIVEHQAFKNLIYSNIYNALFKYSVMHFAFIYLLIYSLIYLVIN